MTTYHCLLIPNIKATQGEPIFLSAVPRVGETVLVGETQRMTIRASKRYIVKEVAYIGDDSYQSDGAVSARANVLLVVDEDGVR